MLVLGMSISLFRAASTVGGFTLISRILGFVRDQLFAYVLGTGMVADAFFSAQRFPNLFRSLFAEGAFSSAFVPIFARKLESDGIESARGFAESALSFLLPILILVTLLAEIAMPWIMAVYAPGFAGDPPKFALTALFSRLTFPYLMLMALSALYAGMLNSVGRFSVAAAAPILLNIVLIFALVVIAPITGLPGHGQAVAVTIAGLLQLGWMMHAGHRAGLELRLRAPRLSPEVRQLLMIALPGTFAAGVTQINAWIGTIIASRTDRAVSWLYYADRLYQLPLGAIGIAVGAVLLPELSRRLGRKDDAGANEAINRAAEMSMLLTLPAAAALMAIPLEILLVLFRHGAFSLADAQATAPALMAFAAGLPAYVLIKVLTPPYFARHDTRTPVKFAAVSVLVNVIGSLGLFEFIGYLGIPVATAAAAWINVALLWMKLVQRGHLAPDRRLLTRLAGVAGSSAMMAILLMIAAHFLGGLLRGPFIAAALALIALVAGGIFVYGALLLLTKTVTFEEFRRAFQ